MRRKIIECDVCGEEVDLQFGWYRLKTTRYANTYGSNIERRTRTIYMCTNCKSAVKDLIRKERGL